jgi:hypothetical protein
MGGHGLLGGSDFLLAQRVTNVHVDQLVEARPHAPEQSRFLQRHVHQLGPMQAGPWPSAAISKRMCASRTLDPQGGPDHDLGLVDLDELSRWLLVIQERQPRPGGVVVRLHQRFENRGAGLLSLADQALLTWS